MQVDKKRMSIIHTFCLVCRQPKQVIASYDGIIAWQEGALIQDALPKLSIGDKELLTSNTCDKCFDNAWVRDYVSAIIKTARCLCQRWDKMSSLVLSLLTTCLMRFYDLGDDHIEITYHTQQSTKSKVLGRFFTLILILSDILELLVPIQMHIAP